MLTIKHMLSASALIAFLLTTTAVTAHEFWIEPGTSGSNKLILQAQVGHGLEASGQQAFPKLIHQQLWVDGQPVSASTTQLTDDQLQLVLDLVTQDSSYIGFQSNEALHRYASFDEFIQFTEEVGHEWAVSAHREAELPEQGFIERFVRYTKTLLPDAAVEISDIDTPMPFEWQIAASNQVSGGTRLLLQLTEDDQPMMNSPFTLFIRSDADAKVTHQRLNTDDQGAISITVQHGSTLLLSATELRRSSRKVLARTGAVWESHWISLLVPAS